jgi:hypothetical protein
VIPRPLDQIEWTDLEALKDSGREESDTIEYKASFSGGSDYLSFNENQRDKAIRGVAREVIAFLNGRGGDVVIGAEEEDNENSRVRAFKPIPNVSAVADRLAQSLSAVIEPYQSIVGVRAIRNGADDEGVIVVRAPQSLRAPHRLTKDKECYIRRGKESVPMPMDEVQDLTVRRTDLRRERLEALEQQMLELTTETVGRSKLSLHRFHIRLMYLPFSAQEISIDETVKSALRGSNPMLQLGDKTEKNDVAFGNLGHDWRPILRGARIEQLTDQAWNDHDFMYCAKSIRSDGLLISDFACRATLDERGESAPGFHVAWVAGFLANTLQSFANVVTRRPAMQGGILRLGMSCAGSISMGYGEGMWNRRVVFPPGILSVPDCEVFDAPSIKNVFELFQLDIASIAGVSFSSHYSFADQ